MIEAYCLKFYLSPYALLTLWISSACGWSFRDWPIYAGLHTYLKLSCEWSLSRLKFTKSWALGILSRENVNNLHLFLVENTRSEFLRREWVQRYLIWSRGDLRKDRSDSDFLSCFGCGWSTRWCREHTQWRYELSSGDIFETFETEFVCSWGPKCSYSGTSARWPWCSKRSKYSKPQCTATC